MQIEEAKEVVKVASHFLAEQEPAARESRLEQIEQRGDGEWSVVLSFPDMDSDFGKLSVQMGSPLRVYKELVVNDQAKEVTALRFWK